MDTTCRAIHIHVIADALYANGLISDKLTDEPFETRMARLFDILSDEEFL